MKSLKSVTLAAVLLALTATITSVSAQGPLKKEVFFTINSPFEMGNNGITLPEGTYILHQVSMEDLNLFGLYKDDTTHPPIALVRTTRIDYHGSQYPGKTEMLVNMNEEAAANTALPVINGWNIPGADGWEIISIDANSERIQELGSDLPNLKRKNGKIVVTMTTSGF